jgi:mannose-6-phosphate isomerase-like protein (cupin superfamily)
VIELTCANRRSDDVLALRLQRAPDHSRLGGRDLQWEFECLDFAATERRLNAYWVKFHQPAKPKSHQHDGAEFVHVLKGTLVMQVAGEVHELEARDSIYFDPSQPHSYASGGIGPCEAVVITAP